MKSTRWLWGLCILLFLWALTATGLWLKASNPNPTISKQLSLELSTQTSKSVRSLENVSFLRQFLEQFFTYNSSNFWQTQTALAFSMEPELRQKRLSEIDRLKDKLSSKDYAQKARLLSLVQNQDGLFSAVLEVQMSDAGKESVFFMEADLALSEIPRSVENSWGREVTSLQLRPQTINPLSQNPKPISLSAENPLLLAFHCAVENIRLAKDSPLIAKMTTMNVSEIQVLTNTPLTGNAKVGANCKDQSFEIELEPSTSQTTVFLDIGPLYEKQKPLNTGKKKKSPYQKTLEDQLDFIMEE